MAQTLKIGEQTAPVPGKVGTPGTPGTSGTPVTPEKEKQQSSEVTQTPGAPRPVGNVVAPNPPAVEQAQSSNTARESLIQDLPKLKDNKVEPTGIYIEGLGYLDELAQAVGPEDELDEGEGEKVVILHENVTGVDGIYKKGRVTRVSKLAPTWFETEFGPADKARAAANIQRLFSLGAIRFAVGIENEMKEVEVGFDTPQLVAERAERLKTEREKEALIQRIKELEGEKN